MGDTPDYSVQPRPRKVEGAVSVHDVVVRDLELVFDDGLARQAAIAGVLARKEYGLEKYGTVLHIDNGRDYLADIDDEVGDLVAYLRALILKDPEYAEQFDLWTDYRSVIVVLLKVRALLADRQAAEEQS